MKFHILTLLVVLYFIMSCQSPTSTDKVEKQDEIEVVEEEVIPPPPEITELDMQHYKQISEEALQFCWDRDLNTEFYILIDMSRHSGVERFYLWDFANNEIREKYLVSHGCGENPWMDDESKENPTFSNVPETHLSSLGRYIIGERGYSNFGVNIKYLLHGLDETNSNALARVIVFHSWEQVPDVAPYPAGTPEGWGCPAISDNAFVRIDALLQEQSKNTLMWIVN